MTKPSYEELRITKHSGSPQIADSASGDKSSKAATEIRCPFCGDTGFDLLGLKIHLVRGHCEEFEKEK